jgi:hypothetical protein
MRMLRAENSLWVTGSCFYVLTYCSAALDLWSSRSRTLCMYRTSLGTPTSTSSTFHRLGRLHRDGERGIRRLHISPLFPQTSLESSTVEGSRNSRSRYVVLYGSGRNHPQRGCWCARGSKVAGCSVVDCIAHSSACRRHRESLRVSPKSSGQHPPAARAGLLSS